MSGTAISGFDWHVERDEGGVRVTLVGTITEASDFAPILERASGRVRVDLAGIRRINSSGIREWLRFVEALSAAHEVVLERCPAAFVQQLNMIANMAGGGRVASVFLPYQCASCDASRDVLLALGGGAPVIADSVPCSACGGAMEFDDIQDAYLAFAR
jgi:hypothetical protein